MPRTGAWGIGLAATIAVISGLAVIWNGASLPFGIGLVAIGAVFAVASAGRASASGRARGADSARSVATAPYVVVGLGNDIASDDGVGIHVARALEAQFREREDVEVLALPWGGFALLDVLRGRRRAALVDCITTGAHPPGEVVRLDETDFSGSVRLNSYHDISYPTAMDLGRSLGWEMPDDVAIWGIEGTAPEVFGEDLSPATAASVDEVVRQVTEYINRQTEPSMQRVGAAP
jgi:hydrogenase maturation protease